jgi:hypothetical protein
MFFLTLKHVTKNDVVFCATTPFTLPYSDVGDKVTSVSDPSLRLYQSTVMAGLVQPTSLVTRTFVSLMAFYSALLIVTIGRDVGALLLAYKGVENRKIKFIPNWPLLPIEYREIAVGSPFRPSGIIRD